MTQFVRYVTCEECGGSGRQDVHLKGAGVIACNATHCWRCWGFGIVRQAMTKDEVLAALSSPCASEGDPK